SKENPEFFQELIEKFIGKLTGLGSLSLMYMGTCTDDDIEAIFKTDIFGFSKLCVIASWRNQLITEKEIQKFADSFESTKNGIFITLSEFESNIKTDATEHYIINDKKILLLNGTAFLEKLISYDIGVRTIQTYEIKEIDYNFFEHSLNDKKRTTHNRYTDE
ncbi:MAG: restriction endonuclease, partial [Planctomycetaceae bacterium]|nr:restriction endonuclease [Planctomycetaceae bacterium]